MTDVCAVVTTLDNLPNLKETVTVLRGESLSEIVVVNNGSRDGTQEWLDEQDGLTVVHRENRGAGPGRNAGLDVAKDAAFYLMLDGGIRPLRGGTARMLDYLNRHADVDVIGVHIFDFETDKEKAWRRWHLPILDDRTYQNTRLSHTAYCLSRARAWDGLRFCEEGPFGEPGWGADDDEMMYRWNEAGITVHVVRCACNEEQACTGVHPYRRASGSFTRLFDDTGIWPNQYGSVYEKRVVWLNQKWPHQQTLDQWGEPWMTVVVRAEGTYSAKVLKRAHERLRRRRFGEGWGHKWNPYSVVAWMPGEDEAFWRWAEPRMLRQHHGDTIIRPDGKIIRRDKHNEAIWTGDFRLVTGLDWRKAVRPGAFYYALVETVDEVDALMDYYDGTLHPPQPTRLNMPPERREIKRHEWAKLMEDYCGSDGDRNHA
jgi:glycosyltransferase involved in cell wall biosynthesis